MKYNVKTLLALISLALFSVVIVRSALFIGEHWELIFVCSGGSFLLWVFYRIYRKIKADQIRQNVLQAEYNTILLTNAQIEAETRQIQAETAISLSTAQLENHINLTRIYPENGYFPALVGDNLQLLPSAMDIRLLPQLTQTRGAVGIVAEPNPVQVAEPVGIPRAPHFNEMKHTLVSDEHLILCYDQSGPVYGEIVDLLSTAITGKPGRGKTTALMYYVAILLQAGAEIVVFDPHGVMNLLAEFNGQTLKHMPATAKVVYLSNPDDMYSQLDILTRELARRNERYQKTHGKAQFLKHPLLLLVDELPALSGYDLERKRKDDGLMKMIKRFVLEARKWNCYFIGSSQTFDAQTMPTQIRDNLSSKMVFYSSDMRAKMVGLEKTAIENLLPMLKGKGKAGTMIFDCSRFDEPFLAAIPMLTQQDLADFVGCTVEGTIEEYDDDDNRLDSTRERHTDELDAVEADVMPAIEALRPSLILVPRTPPRAHRATYTDAVSVWNELGEMGRPRLQKELQARGFECSDDLAKNLLAQIKTALENQAGADGGEQEIDEMSL